MTAGRSFARRAGWGVADQALASLINFALSLAVARGTGPEDFGVFALAFAFYGVTLLGSRAVSTDPLAIRYSTASRGEWRKGTALATGGALGIGVFAGACSVTLGAMIGGRAGDTFLILGCTLPGLLLQDSWRYAFFARGTGGRAFANDLAWALLLLPALAALVAGDYSEIRLFLLAWGGSATVAAVLGMFQSAIAPKPLGLARWWQEHRDLVPRYLGEAGAHAGMSYLVLYGIGAVAGLASVGALRGGYVLLGPVNILILGAGLAALPEAARLLHRNAQRLAPASALLSAGLALAALAWGAGLLLLPREIGVSLIGSIWDVARPLIIPLALAWALTGVVVGASIGLRALAAARRSLRALLSVSPLIFVAPIIGAATYGATGAAWGLVVGYSVAAAVWWWHLRRALDEHIAGAGCASGSGFLSTSTASVQPPSGISGQEG